MNVNLPFSETDEKFTMIMRRELELLIMKFMAIGWKKSKDVPTAIHNSSKDLIVFLNHKILTYVEDQKKRVPWVELRILSQKEITEETKEMFLNELSKLTIEPFIDGTKFTKVEKVGMYYTTSCYINPDKPGGFEYTGAFLKSEEVNKKRRSLRQM